jgi:dual serine/threonine and tyrosine protein kinase
MITPIKIEYAREKEQVLFESLNSLASVKQEELKHIIRDSIESNREQILRAAREYEFKDIEVAACKTSADEAILSSDSSFTSISVEPDNEYITVKYARDFKKCTNQIQDLVVNMLNNAIGEKLTDSIKILKETYIGTLKRCLITLEDSSTNLASISNLSYEFGSSNPVSVSKALQQVV